MENWLKQNKPKKNKNLGISIINKLKKQLTSNKQKPKESYLRGVVCTIIMKKTQGRTGKWCCVVYLWEGEVRGSTLPLDFLQNYFFYFSSLFLFSFCLFLIKKKKQIQTCTLQTFFENRSQSATIMQFWFRFKNQNGFLYFQSCSRIFQMGLMS